jgi:hypothetical protein
MQAAVLNAKGVNPEGKKRPSILALSRQGMPNLPGTSIDGVLKGGYIVQGGEGKPDVILIGTGEKALLIDENTGHVLCGRSMANLHTCRRLTVLRTTCNALSCCRTWFRVFVAQRVETSVTEHVLCDTANSVTTGGQSANLVRLFHCRNPHRNMHVIIMPIRVSICIGRCMLSSLCQPAFHDVHVQGFVSMDIIPIPFHDVHVQGFVSTDITRSLFRQFLPFLVQSVQGSTAQKQKPKQDPILMFCLAWPGSELAFATDAGKELEAAGIKARVVSMPSTELFDEQSAEYKESILPKDV